MKKYYSFWLFISFALILTACSKDNMEPDPDPAIPYQKIGEGYAIGGAVRVELYTEQGLTTGYNPLFIALYDSLSKQPVKNARITLLPMMDMGNMQHAAPADNPDATATDGLFHAGLVFTMPSGSMGSWTIGINVSVAGKQGALTLPLTVIEPAKSRVRSFISAVDDSKFIVALLQPEAPKVGVNDMEIAIYKAKSMMEFPADSSLTVTLTPEMPAMGHGSPNNIDPVHIAKGHYRGKVNFTMTGLWQLNLRFKAGTGIADDATFFEVNF